MGVGSTCTDLVDDFGDALAAKGRFAAEKLIDHGARGEEVGPGIDLVVMADRLLGGHVLRCSQERRLHGANRRGTAYFRDTEVQDFDDFGADSRRRGNQEDVLGFQIAMHDALIVRGGEGGPICRTM